MSTLAEQIAAVKRAILAFFGERSEMALRDVLATLEGMAAPGETICGIPVVVDETMPPNEIELRSGKNAVRLVNVGAPSPQQPTQEALAFVENEPASDWLSGRHKTIALMLDRFAAQRVTAAPVSGDARETAKEIVRKYIKLGVRFVVGPHVYAEWMKDDIAAALTAATDKARRELIDVLKPFAEAAENLDDKTEDRSEIWELPAAMSITAGDLRRAARARTPQQPTQEAARELLHDLEGYVEYCGDKFSQRVRSRENAQRIITTALDRFAAQRVEREYDKLISTGMLNTSPPDVERSPQQPTQEPRREALELLVALIMSTDFDPSEAESEKAALLISDALNRFAAQRVTAAREAKARDHQAAIDNLRECGVAFRMIHDALTELSDAVPPIRERDVGPPSYTTDAEEVISGFATALTAATDKARREALEQAAQAAERYIRRNIARHSSYADEVRDAIRALTPQNPGDAAPHQEGEE